MINGLPEKLKMLRQKHNLTQRQVSARIGVSPAIISGYETGERTPSTEVLLALSYLYNCSTDYLLGRTAISPSSLIKTEGLTDQQIKAIRSLIDAITANN